MQNFDDVSDLVIGESGTVSHMGATISGGPQTFTVTITGVMGDGTLALEVSTSSDVESTTGNALAFSVTSDAVTVDHIAPDAPTVDGATPTGDTTPTWTWTPTGGGNGNYRYKLDDSDLSTGATLTTENSYTPASALTETIHTLHVQERDDAGNWSLSGSFAITIDTSVQEDGPSNWSASGSFTIMIDTPAPSAPIVSGTTPTNDTTPTWTWASAGGGNGNYRYQMNSEAGSWTATADTSYTPATPLTEAAHVLYVQEQDDAGNWSASDNFAITVDTSNFPPGVSALTVPKFAE